MGIHRGHKARPLEWVAEKLIFGISLSAIAMVFLIFLFVGREALPVFLGETNSALIQDVIPSADLDKVPPAKLAAYLGMTSDELKSKDHETLQTLMEIREEAANDIPANLREDKDSKINTTQWRYLLPSRSGNPSARFQNTISCRC